MLRKVPPSTRRELELRALVGRALRAIRSGISQNSHCGFHAHQPKSFLLRVGRIRCGMRAVQCCSQFAGEAVRVWVEGLGGLGGDLIVTASRGLRAAGDHVVGGSPDS
ncbi:hypothetical protein GCM10023082_06840 [Streptomyces tremellae]|uniref:Uncharacterized protein n=1 Tax=Streptomyces tremellae TaxID=1124239 RepID=A0ABP7E0F3_9ACTN